MKIKEKVLKYITPLYITGYITVGLLMILLYVPARTHMIVQDAWIWIIKSNVTFNFILFFFMWGIISDKFTKSMPKWKSWAIFLIGLAIIVLTFHYAGGYETIWSK